MTPVMVFISSLYDAFNEFVAGTNSVDSELLSLILSAIFISLFYYKSTLQLMCSLFNIRFIKVGDMRDIAVIYPAETQRKFKHSQTSALRLGSVKPELDRQHITNKKSRIILLTL